MKGNIDGMCVLPCSVSVDSASSFARLARGDVDLAACPLVFVRAYVATLRWTGLDRDVEMQALCAHFAALFNARQPPRKVHFAPAWLVRVRARVDLSLSLSVCVCVYWCGCIYVYVLYLYRYVFVFV